MTSLVAVRTALNLNNHGHASTFIALMDENKFSPYKSKEFARQRLGSKGADYPTLGRKQVPKGLRKHHSTKELQNMCLRDLQEARDHFGDQLTYFTQPSPANQLKGKDQEDAGMQVINTLVDPDFGGSAMIVTFPSDTLDQLCVEQWEAPPNLLRATLTTCTVLPNDTLLPMHHSNEGTMTTTLLSGFIVWIIWPPTENNHRSLQTAYENLAAGKDDEIGSQIDFEGGMIFVQTEGDGLRIPPHSVMMALTTSTAVLATYSEVTVENFISMFQKLPLLRAWFQTELDGDRKQAEFNASILRHLDILLNGNPDEEDNEDSALMLSDPLKLPRTKGGILDTLLRTWDHAKNDLATVMGPADHETMENIWEAFLVDVTSLECRICGKHIQKKEKLMKEHFIGSHWTTLPETKRYDFKEVLEEDEEHIDAMDQVE
jgi:hypothetical protein